MASVGIAIPCYNYGRYLRDCVASVFGQGVEDVRLLIVDNASTDDSADIARAIAAEDPRVEVLAREKNMGPHASFNAGVDWAPTDYFMVLCADDILAPGCLANALAVMEADKSIAFTYGTDIHHNVGEPFSALEAPADPNWRIWSGDRFIEDRCRNPEHYIAAGHVLVRTSAQKQAGHYRVELPHTDDFEMLLRLARYGGVAYTAAPQGIKRMHASNRTHDYLAERTRDLAERLNALECFFRNEGASMPQRDRLMRLGRRSLAERAYWSGVRDWARGRESAGALFKFARELEPSTAYLPPVSYLLRMDRPLGRIIAETMSETFGGRRAA